MPSPHSDHDLALTVRAGDYDRFLCIQLAPPEKRAALYALTAFHGELARIAETVSEPLLGHIRLAWWREALEEITAGRPPRNHPVVIALAALYVASPHLFSLLEGIIEARAMDLDESLMAEEEGWQRYLDGTAGNLHLAWAHVLSPERAFADEVIIRRQARAYAMVGLLRAIPYMHRHGFLRFPRERLQAAGVTDLVPNTQLTRFIDALIMDVFALLKSGQYVRKLGPMYGIAALAKLQGKNVSKAKYNIYLMKNLRLTSALRILQVKLFLC